MTTGGGALVPRARILIALAESPRLLVASGGLFVLYRSDAGATAPAFDALHTAIEAVFTAIVILTIGKEGGRRTWWGLSGALCALAIVLVGMEFAIDGHVEIARPHVALAIAGATFFANALSWLLLTAVSRHYRFRQVTAIEVPHLLADALVSGGIFVATLVAGSVPIVDTIATVVLAVFICVLAWRAAREARRH